ncbi:class I SAM-dependent methyltransferase [Luteimicrobium subarcticum]|uniref:Methyltransferase family protein n=1 Tax=Luteimicrobium subarcticum TaxID=620910 RepID=A0A2M8WRY8_9MICO|nr:class I SAM-dependent methyltransferase [Luteimicrobium subarcticum]PJI93710.1 methyltransferase family protein [Luteimicrobium subarcticum]
MWAGFAVLYATLAVLNLTLGNGLTWVPVLLLGLAACFVVGGALYLHASRRGKFVVWDELLAGVPAPGRALDLGCGRGAVAIMTALRFPAAEVDGIDLWRSVDQSGNSPAAAAAHVRANGVDDRVAFTTGDMTELPYEDASFDLVTASLSIHNIPTRDGRDQTVAEAWRVLRPGGTLVVLDISKARECAERLRALGAEPTTPRDVGWRVWWSGPWMATRVVTATRP